MLTEEDLDAIRQVICEELRTARRRIKDARRKMESRSVKAVNADIKRTFKREASGHHADIAKTLPDWIDVADWQGFVEMRAKIRAPLTDRAKSLVMAELTKLHDQGIDAGAALRQSIEHSWRGVFPPKINGSQNGNGKPEKWHPARAIHAHIKRVESEDAGSVDRAVTGPDDIDLRASVHKSIP